MRSSEKERVHSTHHSAQLGLALSLFWPETWRYTFATLLQDGNVDPLIRQQVIGHLPTVSSGLGMTAKHMHTRPETLRRQVEQALRRWPESLKYGRERSLDQPG
jgi:hypothetical protein